MKTLSAVMCALVAVLAACGTSRDNGNNSPNAQSGSAFCFGCHSENTQLGHDIEWAQGGYENSVHALGQVERVYTQTVSGGCPSFTVAAGAATTACTSNGGTVANGVCTVANATAASCTAAGGTFAPPNLTGTAQCVPSAAGMPAGTPAQVQTCTNAGGTVAGGSCDVSGVTTQNGCETAGGTWVGPRWTFTTIEHTGSNAFYSNATGCQMCHTAEGFRKRIDKQYDAPGYGSIQYAWDPKAWVGSPTTTPNTPLTADVIDKPSPIGCFGCHNPHSEGTPDGKTLPQAIKPGTAVTTQVGSVYGNATTGQNKEKGHLCSECHQVAFNSGAASVAEAVGNIARGSGTGTTLTLRGVEGPHHGPQTDMLLGKGGAEYRGTAGTFTFAGSYGSSPHTTRPDADCVSCHMQSDTSDINLTGRFGVSPAVGGHAFTNKGTVHGQETVLAVGCGSTKRDANGNVTASCHTVTGVTGSAGSTITPSRFTTSTGFLQTGDAFFQKGGSNYHQQMNELLVRLANPSRSCDGLISAAARAAGGRKLWTTLSDGTADPRCLDGGATGILRDQNPQDNNASATVRFVKGLWNFKFALVEDKSFGVHNTKYALQLLYDTCVDLTLATAAAGSSPCGAGTGGSCDACNGQFVQGRPQ